MANHGIRMVSTATGRRPRRPEPEADASVHALWSLDRFAIWGVIAFGLREALERLRGDNDVILPAGQIPTQHGDDEDSE